MTRKKVKLDYIHNDSARKASFKKRKKGLLKKVTELTTLCGIDACAIIYSPYEAEPEIWPSQAGAHRVLTRYQKMPKMEQSKKMVDHDNFLRQRISKASEQLQKISKENHENEMRRIMFQSITGSPETILHLNMPGLNELGWRIDQNLKEINKRIETLTSGMPHNVPSNEELALMQQLEMNSSAGFGDDLTMNMGDMQNQQWFMDMNTNTNMNTNLNLNMMNPQEQPQLAEEEPLLAFWGL